MKLFITFVLGVLTGASLLWFGFRKDVVTLNNRLVVVDRFSGKADRIFVSCLEAEQLERAETRRIEDLDKNGTTNAEAETSPTAKAPEWRELTESEIKQLEFDWHINPHVNATGVIEFACHNPFERQVRIEKVRVYIPSKEGHAAVTRDYAMQNMCPALTDVDGRISSINMPSDQFYQLVDDPTPQRTSSEDPFGAGGSPAQKKSRKLVGTITLVRALIQN
ncbi:hypothetical protein [Prosthecobacter sp.]|uniref:hypothetical protein n=1 Tax=Prosthecobacter sp. TaxID=1965333 RepID=UPI003784032D